MIILLLLALLSGCASEIAPISALSLDQKGENYRLTAELVQQDSAEGALTPSYLSCEGRDLSAVLQDLEALLPGELLLSHAEILLISEQVAGQDLLPVLQALCRREGIRLGLRVCVVRDGQAEDLLKSSEQVFALSELVSRHIENQTMPDFPLCRAVEMLSADGTALLPALVLDADGQIAPAGTSVFANGQLSDYLDKGDRING